MNNTDKQYLQLLSDIMENGVEKDTRAGKVKSVFGRQMRFNLKEGFPILTTKKVFTKGAIHELLWFLQHPQNSHGSMNIEYLVKNDVHIWDDDAYRWFRTEIINRFANKDIKKPLQFFVLLSDDEKNSLVKPKYEIWKDSEKRQFDIEWLRNMSKEEFLDLVLQKVEMRGPWMSVYRFGDIGPVYGKQWRSFGYNDVDQINNIIKTLKNNPNDRRMLCVAFNPDQIEEMALPPCHVMFQFYTRELTTKERVKIFNERYAKGEIPQKYYDWFKEYSKGVAEGMDVSLPNDGSAYDKANIPRYGLSCMWTQRSCDWCLGIPINIISYTILTHMIAKLVNMIPDELIGSFGDCHIYMNQMEGVNEQLSRSGSEKVPQLIIEGKQKRIEDFKYEDFKIEGYEPDPIIKFPLSVG